MAWGLIREMGHVSIQTNDIEGSIFDATQLLGLRVTERTGNEVYLAANSVHHELAYVESEVNGIHSLGLIAQDGDALREIRKRVADENFKIVSETPVSLGVQDGFSFIGPEGWIFEVYSGMQKQ